MDPGVLAKLERLAAAGIEIVPIPEVTRHFVLAREGFAALVQRSGDDFGAIGSSGKVTEAGFAALVWRDGEAYFVAKNRQQPATPHEVERLLRFSADLIQALAPGDG